MAKVLITGGVGFIGSSLARRLIDEGHEVRVFDIYKVDIPGAHYIKGSVLDTRALEKAMRGCEYVVHLAAILGVFNAGRNPLECLDVNILGTRNVLDACVKAKIKKILFSSSSEVYGEPDDVPIKETATLRPKSEYGVSKVVGEEYCRAYQKQHGLPYVVVRFFNVYGDRQRDDFVMSVFANAATKRKPLTVHGDGKQMRAFCHVDDVVEGVQKLLFSKKALNDTYNLGNPREPVTMHELAKRIATHASCPLSLIRKVPFSASDRTKSRDIRQRLPNISKAKRVVGYSPKIHLDEGIKRVLVHRKKYGNEEVV